MKLLIIAGEVSGDNHGGNLVAELKKQRGDPSDSTSEGHQNSRRHSVSEGHQNSRGYSVSEGRQNSRRHSIS